MRKADRLFQIIQSLHHERVVTARQLAQQLAVSERTIYRDIQDLSLSGVPITGEAGAGYRLLKGFRLAPLMFNEEELAAVLVGARMVQTWADPLLAQAARLALAKIEHVIPERLRPELERQDILVPAFAANRVVAETLALLRDAIKRRRKIHFEYQRADAQQTTRTVQPLGLVYWGKVWTLVAWCELRDDFRHFRLDRMRHTQVLTEPFQLVPGRTLEDFLLTRC